MAQPAFRLCGTGGNLQCFGTCFMPQLQPGESSIDKTPAPLSILPIFGFDISERFFQRISHTLGRSMRDAKLRTNLFKADTAASGSRHLGKTNKILSLRKGHARLLACQLLSPL
jgi:hypothetical protein